MAVGGQRHALASLPPGNGTCTHCTGGSVDPGAFSGRVLKISPPPVLEPRNVEPVASRYNDYAIPAAITALRTHTSLSLFTSLKLFNMF